MKKLSTHLLLALCLVLLAGCSPASSDTGSAQFAVSVPQSLNSSISRVSVTSSAADFPSVSVDLVSSGGSWGGTLGNIPAGANRSFLGQAFDASGTLLFQGSASGVSISANETALVAITLQQVNAPPPFQNEAPVIKSLAASSTSVPTGGSFTLTATAQDPNPEDTLTYSWSATAGAFSSTTAASTSWTAPATIGLQTLTFTVTDSKGLSSSMSLRINVTPSAVQGNAQFSISFNSFPQVSALDASSTQLVIGQTTSVSVSASDVDGDSLSYAWSASCTGTWASASSSSAQFTPTALPTGACNNCRLTVSVSDGRGGQTAGTVALCISATPAPQHFNPVILSATGSSGLASPGQVLTYEVVASDPEGTALSFSWAANTGTLGTPATSATSSGISWTAPACVTAGTPTHLTATITNAFNQTTTKSFSVTGLPVCASGWATTGSLREPRTNHVAALLPNGKVLVVGGFGMSGGVSTEVYDPASGSWSATSPMSSARIYHTVTLLADGKVLAVGGDPSIGGKPLASSEVYDPASGTWSYTGPMATARDGHTATLLPDGKLLVAGGYNDYYGVFARVEVYDPASGTWSATANMSTARYYHTATLLPNGKLLVVGGSGSVKAPTTAELYDPATATWSATGAMISPRNGHTATRLPNGKVLIAGGSSDSGYLAKAEVYDPATGTWSATGPMVAPRSGHTATLLNNGKVFISGGYNGTSTISAGEVYDPATGTWSTVAPKTTSARSPAATLLLNGKVLLSGGSNGPAVATSELYTP